MALTPRPYRPILLPLLLVAIVLLAGVLAYEALAALREREAMATRSLRDFVAFAAGELSAKAGEIMAQEVRLALDPITATPATSPYDRLAGLDAVQGAAAGVLPCVDSATERGPGVFELDLRDGSLQVTGSASPALRRWMADTLGTLVRVSYRPEQHFAVLPDIPGDSAEVLLFAVKWSQLGAHAQPMAPIGVVGFFRCRSAFGVPLVRSALARRPLLPGALGGGRPNDSVLVVQLSDAHGREIWRNGNDPAPGLDASVPLETPAGLHLAVALRAGAVAGLTVGAPATLGRLPWLLALLGVSVGLVAVAFAQLRREQELARLRSDFTSSVSHELRTPLAQILLAAETLELGRARTEEARNAAASLIVGEGRRLLYMVENVLSFARHTRGVPMPQARPTRLAPLCREILTQWLATVGADARIVPDLDEGAWAMVDAGTMTQILHNLVDNALKFGPRGQTITVAVHREGEHVALTVMDEGPGIAVEDCERIWEPFVRTGAAGAAGGTGLGLTVVRDLVLGLRGTARVEAAPGGGARFVVELPACDPLPAEQVTRDAYAGERA